MTDDPKTLPPGTDDHFFDDQYFDDDDGDLDDLDLLEQECGLRGDGQCGMAGTEHCDFICPLRDSVDFAGSAAWNKKHAKRGRK